MNDILEHLRASGALRLSATIDRGVTVNRVRIHGVQTDSRYHCSQGHELDEANTYFRGQVKGDGIARKRCRQCRSDYRHAWRAKRKAKL